MRRKFISLLVMFPILFSTGCTSEASTSTKIENIVNNSIQPVLEQHNIPGMAVAITVDGKRYYYNYGVASKETEQPVTSQTLFEIGSVSKTFTATLACYAQASGKLSLDDHVSKYMPSLLGSGFDHVSLINLGTHTAGGFPLQVPEDINNTEQLMDYFKNWQPSYKAGTYRSYANPSIGLLGMITAKSMNEPFNELMENVLFAKLGLNNSYIDVPKSKENDYAQGYNKQELPVRLNEGILADEAYGIKSSTTDLIRFVEANMQLIKLDENLQRAIDSTHIGYFKVGAMTQDLIWEQYEYPVKLEQLVEGNSAKIAYQDTIVTALNPPLQPQKNVLINKTGSTNGYGAYVAFIPSQKIGIVMLANKPYPNETRAATAYQILTQLESVMKEKY